MCSTDCESCRALKAALIDLLAERSLDSLTMEEVAARAALAEDPARHRCGTLAACAVACYRESADELYRRCNAVLAGGGGLQERHREMQEETIAFLLAKPGRARLHLLESDGPLLREHRAAHRDRFVSLLASDREAASEGDPLPALHFEVIAGAAFRVLRDEFEAGRLGDTLGRLDQLYELFEPAVAA
jgi:hypothetical protein